MVQMKLCFLLLPRQSKKRLMLNNANGGVIEIVLYLNGVLHETVFNFHGKRRFIVDWVFDNVMLPFITKQTL